MVLFKCRFKVELLLGSALFFVKLGSVARQLFFEPKNVLLQSSLHFDGQALFHIMLVERLALQNLRVLRDIVLKPS